MEKTLPSVFLLHCATGGDCADKDIMKDDNIASVSFPNAPCIYAEGFLAEEVAGII